MTRSLPSLVRTAMLGGLVFAVGFALPARSEAADAASPPGRPEMKVDLVQDLHWTKSHGAMTNWFYDYKWKEPETQVRILKECGYESLTLSLKSEPARWAMLPGYLAGMKRHGVKLTGIHVVLTIEDDTYPAVIKQNLPLLKDSKALLIPSISSRTKRSRTDPAAIERAAKLCREMAADCRKYGLGGVAMYTHVGDWVETVDDALRVAKAADDPNVGTIFHLHHFQATKSRDLHGTLRRAMPYLMCVILQGTDADKATHKVLGEGTFDMVPLVRTLHEMGYQGPLCTMGYTQSGDIPAKLARGRQAWERIKSEALRPPAQH